MSEPRLVRLGTMGNWAVEYGFTEDRQQMFYGIRREKHWLFRDVLDRKDMPRDFPTDENEIADTVLALLAGFLAELHNNIKRVAVYERKL